MSTWGHLALGIGLVWAGLIAFVLAVMASVHRGDDD